MFSKRIGLIGDVHQQDDALSAALDHLAYLGADCVLCTGDLADGVGSLERCCNLLRDAGVQVVRGNHDRWLLKGTARDLPDAFPSDALVYPERDYLKSLPATRDVSTIAGSLLLCHAMGEDDMGGLNPWDEGYALESNSELQRILSPPRWKLVVAGHTHHRMVRAIGGVVFVNPGTLLPADGRGPGLAVLDLEQRAVRFFEIGAGGVEESEVVGVSQNTQTEEGAGRRTDEPQGSRNS